MEYTSKARVVNIKATSRTAIKIKDNFYTIEYTEEREIPDIEDVDIEKERILLFDACNAIVDQQCEDIINTFQPKRK